MQILVHTLFLILRRRSSWQYGNCKLTLKQMWFETVDIKIRRFIYLLPPVTVLWIMPACFNTSGTKPAGLHWELTSQGNKAATQPLGQKSFLCSERTSQSNRSRLCAPTTPLPWRPPSSYLCLLCLTVLETHQQSLYVSLSQARQRSIWQPRA